VWAGHDNYFHCNQFEKVKKDVNLVKSENAAQNNRNELARFAFTYEQYADHDRSRRVAIK